MADRKDKKKGTGAGAVVGAAAGGVAGGAAAGAAVGGLTGPAGAAIGAAIGAVVGAVSGRTAADPATSESSTLDHGSHDHASGHHSVHTVIGAFDDSATAQRAGERLTEAGFPREDIHLQHPHEAHRSADGSGSFFSGLYGLDGAGGVPPSAYAQAHTYDEAVRRGSAVLVVDAGDEQQAERASSLLHELGAVDVDERSRQWRAEGWQPPALDGRHDLAATQGETGAIHQGQTLEVVEEQLQVGKRIVDRGGVRVIQRVSSRPVRELVRLREQHAVVERRAVDRAAGGQDLSNVKEGTLEVRDTMEEPVVAKTARVVEEVRVGKEVREHEEVIEDRVRRKDVEIERIGGAGRSVERERAVAADPLGQRKPGGGDKPTL